METPSPDPLNIGELVKEDKPLKAIDFCYHDENEMVTILDCISMCVMVVSYSSESIRGYQMLVSSKLLAIYMSLKLSFRLYWKLYCLATYNIFNFLLITKKGKRKKK